MHSFPLLIPLKKQKTAVVSNALSSSPYRLKKINAENFLLYGDCFPSGKSPMFARQGHF
jgi:hypothetical protein